MNRSKPLATRLRQARTLLLVWKRALRDSHMSRESGPNLGKVDDEQMAAELQRFDAARQALTEAIKLSKETSRALPNRPAA